MKKRNSLSSREADSAAPSSLDHCLLEAVSLVVHLLQDCGVAAVSGSVNGSEQHSNVPLSGGASAVKLGDGPIQRDNALVRLLSRICIPLV